MQPWAPPSAPGAGPPAAPVGEGERWVVVDALRAVALLGIVVVNVAAYRTGVGPNLAAAGGPIGGDVEPLTVGLSALAEGRFYPLFSFLFGWGFAVQDARSRARGRSVAGPWLRRCGVLLAFGVAHGVLLFRGDILTTYAVLGLALLLVRRIPTGWLVAVGAVLVAGQALFAAGLDGLATLLVRETAEGEADLRAEVAVDWAATAARYRSGSFGAVARHRAGELAVDLPLGLLSVGGTVLGMMVLGVAAARAGWVDPRRWPRWLRSGAVPLWLGGLALSVPAAWALGQGAVVADSAPQAAASRLAYALLGPAVALLWAAVVVLAAGTGVGRRARDLLAPAGRMSLTLYLAQSLVASLLFTGYGLGLGAEVGIGAAVAIMVGVWALQVVAAHLWFRAFTTGPLEALARAGTYLRWPRLRRRGAPSPLAPSDPPG
ncbi:MAG TPA: DUF418 domain-containing protein [Acidimicrobiales bacterium]|nr:DUF418 domain-containing protein [Acidimicrobiales bacterium]